MKMMIRNGMYTVWTESGKQSICMGERRKKKKKIRKEKYVSTYLSYFISFLLPTAETQRFADTAETEPAEQLVDAQTAEQTVDDAAQTEPVEQFAHETQDAAEQETDGGDDLEEGFGQQAPERVELLLRVRHVVEFLLRVLNRLYHGGCELLERVC